MRRIWRIALAVTVTWATTALLLLNYAYPRADGSLIQFYPLVYLSGAMPLLAVLGPVLALLLSCALFLLGKRPAAQSALMIVLTLVGILAILTAYGPLTNLENLEHLDAVTAADGEYRLVHSSRQPSSGSGTVIELWLYRCEGWHCEREYRHFGDGHARLVLREGLVYLLVNGEQVYPPQEDLPTTEEN